MSRSLPETYRTVQVGVKRGQRQIQWIVHQRRDGSASQHKFYRHLMFSYCRSVCWNHLMGNYHKVYQSVLSFHVILQQPKSFPKVITLRVKVSSFFNSTKTSVQLCHSGMPLYLLLPWQIADIFGFRANAVFSFFICSLDTQLYTDTFILISNEHQSK
jgi:hypothetical protein